MTVIFKFCRVHGFIFSSQKPGPTLSWGLEMLCFLIPTVCLVRCLLLMWSVYSHHHCIYWHTVYNPELHCNEVSPVFSYKTENSEKQYIILSFTFQILPQEISVLKLKLTWVCQHVIEMMITPP